MSEDGTRSFSGGDASARISAILAIAALGLCTASLKAAPTTIERVGVRPVVVPPGAHVWMDWRWEARPLGADATVFVHVRNAKGEMVFQNDHTPPFPVRTRDWSGPVRYSRNVEIPDSLPPGKYTVFAGLYDKAGQKLLRAGSGVKAAGTVYEVGSFTVDPRAPAPPLDSAKLRTLDVRDYRLTFHDEFDGPLDVSASGPGTKWTAHTPYRGDFGDAGFANPGKDSPFSVKDGVLAITARKVDGRWRSGLLSSMDPHGQGFAQQYGYFEMRAKFPKGPGTWPAFWLNGARAVTDKKAMSYEVDIVEQYGRRPGIIHCTAHWWRPDGTHDAAGQMFFVADTTADFHTYGFEWNERWMRWYFDGRELWRQPTPPEAKTPLYVMLNLALGGGWPIKETPDPSVMLVDYVRVYVLANSGQAGLTPGDSGVKGVAP